MPIPKRDMSVAKLAQMFHWTWNSGYTKGVMAAGKKPPTQIVWSETSVKEQKKWVARAKTAISYCRLKTEGEQ